MRVQDEIKESGYFWLPSAPQSKVPGTLTIKDGGIIKLDIVGSFKGSIDDLITAYSNDDNEIDRIVGHTERYKLVILKNCFYTDRILSTPFGGISKSSLNVDFALLSSISDESGTLVTSNDMLINAFYFSVEGIAEWVGINGFEYNTPDNMNSSIVIKHTPPEEISFNLVVCNT